jgi:tRNA nucleotidyltransferase/poly(A) polymerase
MLFAKLRQQPAAYPAHQALLKLAPDAILVGGAVRDLLLGDVVYDLDYVLPSDALVAARRLGDALGGAYYPLDEQRNFGRVVWKRSDEEILVIDLASLAGTSLEQDLLARDFTVNAIALLPDGDLYDPLGGETDLEQRLLRPCSPHSLLDDPLRVLRAVRFLFKYRLQPAAGLDELVAAAAPGLEAISLERQRDELLKIFALSEPHYAFLQLQAWNLARRFFPALVRLIGIEQSPPHVYDVYEHSLITLRWMARIDRLLRDNATTPATELEQAITDALAPFSTDLLAYLDQKFVPDRPRWLWLRFAALAHDWGKAATRSLAEDGRVRFLGHEAISAELSADWLEQYRCAGAEIAYVRRVCKGHMRPIHLSQGERTPSRRALYRFYRDLGDAAPGALLLHIADHLATYGPDLDPVDFQRHLRVVAVMLEPMTAAAEESILPTLLLNGNDLIGLFDLEQGPRIGELLEGLREAQAVGEVSSREEAVRWIREHLGTSHE